MRNACRPCVWISRASVKPLKAMLCPSSRTCRRRCVLWWRCWEKLIAGQKAPLLGIGVGVPGLVDRKRGTGRYFSFIKQWKDVPVTELLQQRFKTAVTVENNLRVIALAERWFGGGHDLRDYVILGHAAALA